MVISVAFLRWLQQREVRQSAALLAVLRGRSVSSMELREYQRRPTATVFAIRLELETTGFDYVKWGAKQHCKQGDWLVRNGDDQYTVDAQVFARTYEPVGTIEYRKTGTVWAKEAREPGSVPTKEGETHYAAGDYVVYNDREQTDGYAIAKAKFEETYETIR